MFDSLEANQQMHNSVITAIGNNSESNDHTQHRHSMNNELIASADAFAAGQKLGMSENEVLSFLSRKRRKQGSPGEMETENDRRRKLVQSAATLADDPLPGAEIAGVGVREMPEVDPFGQMQDEFQQFGGGAGPIAARAEQVALGMISPDDMTEDERIRMSEAVEREPTAPQSVMRDALADLRASETQQSGFNARIAQLFGGAPARPEGYAQAEGALELQLDPSKARAAQASLVERLAERDRDNSSYRRYGYNQVKAAIEADEISRRLYQGAQPGYITSAIVGDQNLANITRAGAGASFDFPIAMQVPGGPAINPDRSAPIGAYGPVYVSPNTDPSADLNAPVTTRAWMVERQPEYSDGGRSFGNYPQVDVTGATTLFANRLRGQAGFDNISSNLRSVDELGSAVARAIDLGQMKFATREPVTDAAGNVTLKTTPQANPDINGLLAALRYTPAQESELANALYQLEAAKATEINQQGKQQFFTRTGPGGMLERTGMRSALEVSAAPGLQPDARTPGGAGVFFDSPEAVDPREGQAQVARIAPGQTIGGRDIKTALAKLENPEAAMPFMGAVAETDPETGKTTLEKNAGPSYLTRYNKTGETSAEGIERVLRRKEQEDNYRRAKTSAKKTKGIVRPVDQQPVDEATLRGKVVKARLAQERSDRDERKRREKENTIMGYMPPSMQRGSRSPLRRPSM